MSYLSELTEDDRQRWLGVIAETGSIRTHRSLYHWLTGAAMQCLLPHRALIAAWGDLYDGAIHYDIVSSVPAVRTSSANDVVLAARMRQLFDRRSTSTSTSTSTTAARVFPASVLDGIAPALRADGGFVVADTLRDLRTGQSCCYALLCDPGADEPATSQAFASLLPYIDAALAQVPPLLPNALPSDITLPMRSSRTRQAPAADQINIAGALNASMSDRELEIMRWVEMGKTNQEIGTILDISAFTVKNHLQRIFKKLDVYSRAQAVSRLKDSMFYG
jgi:transcriptional regulator EpsA